MNDWCYHTYGRWVEERLVCAVCGKFLSEKYNFRFTGVFPVSELRISNAMGERLTVNSTCTEAPFRPPWTLDESL